MNKRRLYEGIMRRVSQVVKRELNEADSVYDLSKMKSKLSGYKNITDDHNLLQKEDFAFYGDTSCYVGIVIGKPVGGKPIDISYSTHFVKSDITESTGLDIWRLECMDNRKLSTSDTLESIIHHLRNNIVVEGRRYAALVIKMPARYSYELYKDEYHFIDCRRTNKGWIDNEGTRVPNIITHFVDYIIDIMKSGKDYVIGE